MEKKWANIDERIRNSREEWEPSPKYNQLLLSKIQDSQPFIRENRITGLSFVAAGLLLLLINTTVMQTKINDLQYELKSGMTVIKQDVNFTNYFRESVGHGK